MKYKTRITEEKLRISEGSNYIFVDIRPNLAKDISNQTTPPWSFMRKGLSSTIVLEPVTNYDIQNQSLSNWVHRYGEIKSDILEMSLQHICILWFLCVISR